MRTGYLTTDDDLAWLRSTHLKDCPLPESVAGFKLAIMQGNEDCPYAVNLYQSAEPIYNDDFYRVRFNPADGVAFEAVMYNGQTVKPYTGGPAS